LAGLPAEREGGRDERVGGSNSVVESQPSKLLVAGSIPVSRSILRSPESRASFGWQATEGTQEGRLVGRRCERSERLAQADVAQLAERVLGKDEVTSSILVIGSNLRSRLPTSA
jgi:hypothetical protein